MKKLLTIVVCNDADATNRIADDEGIEILNLNDGNIAQAVKNAKGKYTVIFGSAFKCDTADAGYFVKSLGEANTDIICADGVAAFKTSVLRDTDVKTADAFAFCAFGAMNSKSISRIRYNPFTEDKEAYAYSDDKAQSLLKVAERFKKVKSKLNKDVYTYVFDTLCDRLVLFYMAAMLSVKDGALPAEKLIGFDNKLKGEIVLFLALEKRFAATRLQKLRVKSFKISGMTARKFRKILK